MVSRETNSTPYESNTEVVPFGLAVIYWKRLDNEQPVAEISPTSCQNELTGARKPFLGT